MSGSWHLDKMLNVEIGVECQMFVIAIFLTAVEFYNLGHIEGIIRVPISLQACIYLLRICTIPRHNHEMRLLFPIFR